MPQPVKVAGGALTLPPHVVSDCAAKISKCRLEIDEGRATHGVTLLVSDIELRSRSGNDKIQPMSSRTKSSESSPARIRASVVGATGYVGNELVRLLLQHPHVQLKSVTSQTYEGKPFGDVFPGVRGATDLQCSQNDLPAIAAQSDVIFLALPHGAASRQLTKELLAHARAVDMSGDFRFKKIATYEKWYHTEHGNPSLNSEAVYGLSEWNATKIASARLVANPGCYATAAELALLPLVQSGIVNSHSIVVDGKSGLSGAGRQLNQSLHFNEANETLKAYAIASHRHTPEIEEQLQMFDEQSLISFTPHVVPMNRGILITAYLDLKNKTSDQEVLSIYEKCYEGQPFIRITNAAGKENPLPETRFVKGSNFCDIGFVVDERTNRLVVVSALDNLVKGAAGQAVQNMNIMFGLEQTTGLMQLPLFPG